MSTRAIAAAWTIGTLGLVACSEGGENARDAAAGQSDAAPTTRDAGPSAFDADPLDTSMLDAHAPDAAPVSFPDAAAEQDAGAQLLVADHVSAGRSATCVIAGGRAACWGSNASGAIGVGPTGETVWRPVFLAEMGWSTLVRAVDHACGLRGDGVWCMGENSNGALGRGDQIDADHPVPVLPTGFTAITVGWRHSMGIREGKLYAWGSNAFGQSGLGSSVAGPVLEPTQVGQLDGWTEVSGGRGFACAIRGGQVYCFGENGDGQLGRGHTRDEEANATPAPIDGIGYHGISVGERHACALRGDELFCWGDDRSGQLGVGGDGTDVSSPAPVGGTGWTQVSAGSAHSCGARSGALYCWGNGLLGRLGNGRADQVRVPSPVVIPGSAWTRVSAGETHSCGLRGGNVYCWGDDTSGQLGLGGATPFQTSPMPVPAP